MEVGVIIHNAGDKASPENLVKTAQWAEALGYHAIWLTDHVVLKQEVNSWYPYRTHGRWDYPPDTKWVDPLLTLAWAGAAAPTLKLGTSVLVAPLRHPILLAKQLASLDFLSGGRVILGVGAGWMKEEFDLIGQDFANRGRRVIEMVQLMRQLWTGEIVDFKGEFYQLSGGQMQPTPLRKTIPVVWGGYSDAAIRRVARVGDGWHPTQITLAELEAGIKKLRQYCAEAGHDPASMLVVARPGDKYEITPETQAKHLELGIDHLVVDTPIKQDDPDLSRLREKMERVAEVCGLTRRR